MVVEPERVPMGIEIARRIVGLDGRIAVAEKAPPHLLRKLGIGFPAIGTG